MMLFCPRALVALRTGRLNVADGLPACRLRTQEIGAVAQLGEHLLCKQGVIGSIPFTSTIVFVGQASDFGSLACPIS